MAKDLQPSQKESTLEEREAARKAYRIADRKGIIERREKRARRLAEEREQKARQEEKEAKRLAKLAEKEAKEEPTE